MNYTKLHAKIKSTLLKKGLTIFFIFILSACSSKLPLNTSYSGNWLCEENGSVTGYSSYVVILENNNNDSSTYILRNFFNTGDNAMIVIKIQNDSIALVQQPSTQGQIISELEGKGIAYQKLNFNYVLFDGERNHIVKTQLTRP
ncbi:MAG: hypothetical protein AUK44_09500 [Porphyromonadaceae bacterium CG2_30_38_12]|nr:MAG: hypothetical protein AUK44_09500 [Porphyromonadaceae bacterium CG2_30_38_12]